MDYKIVQNALSVCVALCRLHTKFEDKNKKSQELKDEIQEIFWMKSKYNTARCKYQC